MSSKNRIYLDNNATTQLLPDALSGMNYIYKQAWGNPGGPYFEGDRAKKALDWARKTFAKYMDVDPETIYFTSCGTESNNIALRSVMGISPKGRDIIVTSSVEHSSIRKTAEAFGYKHIQVPVDRKGYIIEREFEKILESNHRNIGMISIILAQNEVGTIQPISGLVKIARRILGPNIPFHTDATQILGKEYIQPELLGVDMLTGSAHKFHGPRGVGILYARDGIISPVATPMTGGGQERGCRSGTENVPAIYGAAIAFEYMLKNPSQHDVRKQKTRTIRDMMLASLVRNIPNLHINGDPERGLYNTLSVSFPGGHGHAVCEFADSEGVSIGAGSACSKGSPSESLISIYGTSETARKIIHGTIRLSLSTFTTTTQAELAVEVIIRAYRATNDTVDQAVAAIRPV
jgi:cysteine desulfurase